MVKSFILLVILLHLSNSTPNIDEGFKLINDCPYFNINSQLQILPKLTKYNDKQTLNICVKDFINKEYLTNQVKNAIPSTYQSRIKNNDDVRFIHPSALWLPEKHLFLVAVRVWILSRICYLYVSFFDSDWKEIRIEEMIGKTKIPSILNIPSDWNIENSGPEDGRLFRAKKDEFFIIFNMKKIDPSARPMYIYSFSTGNIRELSIPEHKEKAFVIEKNWSPIIIDDNHIYFVYNYENFQVIDCTDEGPCKRVQGDFKRKPGFLRGGSPYVRFKNTNYFLSLGTSHSEYPKQVFCHVYRPTLTIVHAKNSGPSFELIYTSEPFDFEKQIFISPVGHFHSINDMKLCNGPMSWTIGNSIAKFDTENDIADMIFTLGDTRAVSLKTIGLDAFVSKIIKLYEMGKLPEEDKCSEKLTYFYLNLDDLSLPKMGAEEMEYQRKILNTQDYKSCQKGYYLNNDGECKCKFYLACHKRCSECFNYDYCTACERKYEKLYEGYCICKDGYYFGENTNSCQRKFYAACSNNCANCSTFSNCLKCMDKNSVVDNGSCKCLEGFIEVYNEEIKTYICEGKTYIEYFEDKKYSCYASREFPEADKKHYVYFHNLNLGYKVSNDLMSVALSSSESVRNDNSFYGETQYCNFDVIKTKSQNLQTSFTKDGVLFEVNIKISKL